jgi:6-phosphogluconolactonase
LVFLTIGLLSWLPGSERLYLACPGVGLRVAEFDAETGELTPPREAVSLSGTGFLALHPQEPFLYATSTIKTERKKTGAVAAFRIEDDGQLTLLNKVSAEGSGTCHVSVDASGGVVFAANYGSGSLASFRILENGELSEAVSTPAHEGSSVHPQRQKQPRAHSFVAGPGNRFAYAADLGIDRVVIYRFDSETAQLARVGEGRLAPGAGPRHFKFSASGKQLYVLNELDLTVTVFDRDIESGMLSEKATVSVLPEETRREGISCSEIRVHPSGDFVVTAQRDLETNAKDTLGRNSLSVFRVTDDGSLKRLATVPAGVRIPRNFNFDPSGKWLLAGGQASNDIQIFSFDADTGTLTPKGEPVPCPSPVCFEFVGD